MAVAYPVGLPLPLVSTGGHTEMDSFRTNPVMDGPPRRERLTSNPPATFRVTWRFTGAQMDTFDTWWAGPLLRGALTFNMGLLVGSSVRTHELLFDAAPTKDHNGRLWSVKATLIATNLVYL